jgi:hypothetical protein
LHSGGGGSSTGSNNPPDTYGTPPGGPDDDGDWKTNPTKSESKIWKELKNGKKGTKIDGQTGSKKRLYQLYHTHNDIEVYDKGGKHLGSMDPTTGKIYKGPVPGRTIKF